jgi:hypothetical protein
MDWMDWIRANSQGVAAFLVVFFIAFLPPLVTRRRRRKNVSLDLNGRGIDR